MTLKRIYCAKDTSLKRLQMAIPVQWKKQNYQDREQIGGCQGDEGADSLNTKGWHQGMLRGVNCFVP